MQFLNLLMIRYLFYNDLENINMPCEPEPQIGHRHSANENWKEEPFHLDSNQDLDKTKAYQKAWCQQVRPCQQKRCLRFCVKI